MWYDSWPEVRRTVAVGTAAYVVLVLVLRVSGKRTLSKLSAFDLVVTVALGSVLATILLNQDVALAEGAAALALLAALQFLVTWTLTRIPFRRSVVTARPALLLRDGSPLPEALREQRVTEGELAQGFRAQGVGDLGGVAAVVLETDGSFSVITRDKLGDGSALRGVVGHPD